MNKKIFMVIFILCFSVSANAMNKAISLSYGAGEPDSLRGYRASLQLEPEQTQWKGVWIYFDLNAAHWHSKYTTNKSIDALGIVPVFRFYSPKPSVLTPYLEAGIGLTGLSKDEIGHRQLGAHWGFQDLMGAGFMLGREHQLDFSIRYLHYSNAGLYNPNEGIDVKALFTMAYRF